MFFHLNESQHHVAKTVVDNIIDNAANICNYCERPRYEYVYQLRDMLAAKFGVQQNNVLLGNGSNEILLAIINWARKRYSTLITFWPNYESVFKYAKNADICVEKINLQNYNWHSDLTVLQSLIQPNSIVYISNPNNPTGELIQSSRLTDLISNHPSTLFLVDEAYLEFTNDPGILALNHFDNCIVIKTFSKYYQLAGLRIGYCVGPQQLLGEIKEYLQVDDLNLFACVAAIQTLRLEQQSTHYAYIKQQTNQSRNQLQNALQKLNIEYVEGSANYVFCHISNQLYKYLLDHDITISRSFGDEWRRITVGSVEACNQLIKTINQFYEPKL